MKEETGLTVYNPKLVGIKQFPIDNGRYIVFLFKTAEFTGNLQSSDEGMMEWISREDLKNVNAVDDLEELLTVMENDELTEFQYIISGDEWTVSIK